MHRFNASRISPETHVSKNMRRVANALARAFLHDTGDAVELQRRGAIALGKKWPWLKRLVRDLLEQFGPELQARDYDRIVSWILARPAFVAAYENSYPKPEVRCYFRFHPVMGTTVSGLQTGELPILHTSGDLARWLGLSPTELDWFADPGAWRSRNAEAKLRHYNYVWKSKSQGGVRLIEIPKERLRWIQQQILRNILNRVPVHPSAHGCVKGRSTLTHASEHAGSPVVLKLDLSDFFTSISAARVHALFHSLGYTHEVSRYLTGLTTHSTPPSVLQTMPIDAISKSAAHLRTQREQTEKFIRRHLPQGAPTSPALANLCAWRLDLRLAGAASESGAHYTRYVDDLVISCQTQSITHAHRIALMASGIILEEGFTPNSRKTRVMPQSQAQRTTGLILNVKPNIPRKDFDQLKAILTNCARHGPETQNRDEHPDFRTHLLGRVAYVLGINPERGKKLQNLFDRIIWSS